LNPIHLIYLLLFLLRHVQVHDETQGERVDGGKWFSRQSEPKVSIDEGEKDLEDATINPDGIQRAIMGRTSQFR
jgi:hypothetical protein